MDIERRRAFVVASDKSKNFLNYVMSDPKQKPKTDNLVKIKSPQTSRSSRDILVDLIVNSVDGCATYWAGRIADYLIANGVIVPFCKPGDDVYEIQNFVDSDYCSGCDNYHCGECLKAGDIIRSPDCMTIKKETVTQNDIYRMLYFGSWGRIVFATEEEAKDKIKELKNANL